MTFYIKFVNVIVKGQSWNSHFSIGLKVDTSCKFINICITKSSKLYSLIILTE